MKLKHITFIILVAIMLIILTPISYGGTYFTKNGYTGSGNFSTNWFKSYNTFCLDYTKNTPTGMNEFEIFLPTDSFTGEYANHKNKFFYIFSQLDPNSTRNRNWDSAAQHAIWNIVGHNFANHTMYDTCQSSGKFPAGWMIIDGPTKVCLAGYYNQYRPSGTDELYSKALAYDIYVKSYQEPTIDASNVGITNKGLGPFKIIYTVGETNGQSYGNIKRIRLKGDVDWAQKDYEIGADGIYVKGDNLDSYNEIEVTFEGKINEGYIAFSRGSGYREQDFMFGEAKTSEEIKTANFHNPKLEIILKKTDMDGNAITGAIFGYAAYIEDPTREGYLMTVDNANWVGILSTVPSFKINGSESTITSEFQNLGSGWRKVLPNDKIEIENISSLEYVYVIFNEDIAPEGYQKIEYPVALKFKQENKKWKLEEIGKAVWSDTELRYSFEANSEESVASFEDNILTIKNKKYDELTFNIVKKGRDESGNEINLSGVKFKITTPEKTFEATTDERGKIIIGVTYDGTLGMANGTTIKIEEISTVEGYEKLSTPISITLKKHGENWELKNIIGISEELYSFEKSTEGNLGTITIINKKNGGRRRRPVAAEAGGGGGRWWRRPEMLEKMK